MHNGWIKTSLAALLVWTTLGASQAETLVVLGDDSYFPVVHTQNNKPAGILPAILGRVATLTGDQYDIRLSPWKRAYELAVRGDGGVMGVSFNQERAKGSSEIGHYSYRFSIKSRCKVSSKVS